MDEERWLPVVGYEGLYEVSDQGGVRGVDRIDAAGRRWRGRTLAQGWSGRKKYTRHRSVMMCKDAQAERLCVHHLVIKAFVGPRPHDMEACHRDDNTENNALDNLYYGTRAQNDHDKIRNGRTTRGERNPQALLTETQVCEIARLGARYSPTRIGRMFGVSAATVSDILRGRTWAATTGIASPDALPRVRDHVGSDHHSAKLNEEAVMDIWASRGTVSPAKLAAKYGVKRTAIYSIYYGKSWAHLTGAM